VLGLDEMFWDASKRKLNVDQRMMKWIIPQQQMLCQIKRNAVPLNPWHTVSLKSN
jgi:hypothetical protein